MKMTASYLLLMLQVWGLPVTNVHAAQEQEVCLSCHQYPGLVRLKGKGALKILHIDERKYLASSHGKLACRDCHLGVDKIPHVGANKTDCQSKCHQSAKDRRLLRKTPRKEFHAKQQSVIVSLDDRTSCRVCHQIYPHGKKPFVRAFLNMHTGYLTCETCHLKRAKFGEVSYGWVNTDGVVFKGKPFGSFYDPLRKLTHKPATTLSRISPFIVRNGRRQALQDTWDTAGAKKARAAVARRDKKSKRLIRYYHRDVVTMKRTTACEECHSPHGLLNFQTLGFSQSRSQALMSMPIGNIIKKYDVFYLPELGGF